MTITIAAGINPWLGEDGTPVKNVSDFVELIDYVAIMNYDIWGSWSKIVGPNAPLDDTCSQHPGTGSALSAVKTWTSAGMPPEKLVLGVASYGHSFRVRNASAITQDGSLASFPPFDEKDQPAGDQWDGRPGETDVCGNVSTTAGGIIQYSGMISLGYINSNGTAEPGRIRRFDNCSQTVCILIRFEALELIWLTAFHVLPGQ